LHPWASFLFPRIPFWCLCQRPLSLFSYSLVFPYQP
jgi:hypothetical protein